MSETSVILIAFQEQDNLGVGYLSSLLLKNGYKPLIADFRQDREDLLDLIIDRRPLIVGFSVIFQYHLTEFRDLINYLRDNSVDCHFCAGGHYPSLRYHDLLEIIPEIDSVVLFEGEYTFLELVKAVSSGQDWHSISGLAYRKNGSVTANPLRPLEDDLDRFPPPVRPPLKEYALGKKFATLLAGRGCSYDCAFCSIRKFYSKPAGAIKRLRRPEMVAREMELLNQKLGCTIFMFQDDDFPIGSKKEKKWVTDFCRYLGENKLSQSSLWKISCRPDEIDYDTFKLMKDNGLFLIYLGIEFGNDHSMQLYNKRMSINKVIDSLNIIKELNLIFDYGFMLFDPASTFDSVLENLSFLYEIVGDGSSPVTFCKMLPYAETRIEQDLRRENRLKSFTGFEDYDFLNPKLDDYYAFLIRCFYDWVGKHDGMLNIAKWTRYHLSLYKRYFPLSEQFHQIDEQATTLIKESNAFLLENATRLAEDFRDGADYVSDSAKLNLIKRDIENKHRQYAKEMEAIIHRVKSLTHQPV